MKLLKLVPENTNVDFMRWRNLAVVLLIGVITSVFTAVYFTRMLVALWLRKARPRELHI